MTKLKESLHRVFLNCFNYIFF